MDALKKRLEEVKEKWVDELSHVIWTYRTMPKRSMDETPFSTTYGSEAVIPKKTSSPTPRFDQSLGDDNKQFLPIASI